MGDKQPITLEQLSNLAVDNSGRLYWHGQEVITTLSLPAVVNCAIVIGAGAAVVAAVWPIIQYFLNKPA
jgi:hypothetical protein